MNTNDMNKVAEVFRERNNFLIIAHVNPEGDSIGSQLTVCNMLKKMGKNAVMASHDGVPDNLKFLAGSGTIMREIPAGLQPDTVIVLDCPVKERVGKICERIDEGGFIVNIDHHVSNEFFGNINWVEPGASSVGEMVFFLARKLEVEVEKDMAEAIYTAIVTDTGMFNYDNTSSETHRVVGELIGGGLKPKEMHNAIFEGKSLTEIRLLGKALTTIQIASGGALAYMSLTIGMLQEEGVDSVSTDAFINFPRSIKGVEVAVFLKESASAGRKINVSFRSSGKVDVNSVASRFGGGGHARAAGCVLDCDLAEAQKKVLAEVKEALKAAGNE